MSGTQFQPARRIGTTQNVAYTGTAGTISDSTAAAPQQLRIVCSSAAHVLISAAGTSATTSNGFLVGAGIPEYVWVTGAVKVSAIQLSAGGTLSVVECG